jgi:hypothetical protein
MNNASYSNCFNAVSHGNDIDGTGFHLVKHVEQKASTRRGVRTAASEQSEMAYEPDSSETDVSRTDLEERCEWRISAPWRIVIDVSGGPKSRSVEQIDRPIR